MDTSLIETIYCLADGEKIRVDVSMAVGNWLQQSDRQFHSQRRQDRRHLSFGGYMEDMEKSDMHTSQEGIVDFLARMECYDRLSEAIAQLSEIQQRRLYLYFFAGMSTRQIARTENVNQSTIVRSLKRAIQHLREYLMD